MEIDDVMDDGYAVAFGSVYQGGSATDGTNDVPAVFKSTNDGGSWSRYYLTTVQGDIYDIAVHPTNNNIVFAGGRHRPGGSYESALFKTTNGGTNWTDLSASINGSQINCICFDPNNTDRILLGGYNSVWVSTNNGTDWTHTSQYISVNGMVANPATPDEWFIGTTAGVYQSVDGGLNWVQFNTGLDNTNVQCIAFDHINQVIYVGTNGGGVFRWGVVPGVDESPEPDVPGEFTLHQNYPNPFNMGTEIVYEHHQAGELQLAIYNVKGRLIRTLVDEQQPSGSRTVHWDGRDFNGKEVSSGIYIYRLSTASSFDMKKMILQK